MSTSLAQYREEWSTIHSLLTRLCKEANAQTILLLDREGQEIVALGEIEHRVSYNFLLNYYTNTPGEVTVEKENSIFPHNQEQQNFYVRVIERCLFLVVVFDNSSSLELIRLCVRKFERDVVKVLESINYKAHSVMFTAIGDQEIKALFG